MKDAIRRRGENISAFEIELILQATRRSSRRGRSGALATLGEDDVAVLSSCGRTPSSPRQDVVDYAVAKMAYFMVPRYVSFVDRLPKTPSQKVSKVSLREQAKSDYGSMWDREADGIEVTASPR